MARCGAAWDIDPWQRLNFSPHPHGQRSFLPVFPPMLAMPSPSPSFAYINLFTFSKVPAFEIGELRQHSM
jgi:hypothetical protein